MGGGGRQTTRHKFGCRIHSNYNTRVAISRYGACYGSGPATLSTDPFLQEICTTTQTCRSVLAQEPRQSAMILANTCYRQLGTWVQLYPAPRVRSQRAPPTGTEDNNELCSHIPGPACNSTSGNEEAGPGEGFVHVHPGFHGVGDELSAAGYDWRNPVAEVSIGKPTRVKS